jgi:hypothetical protein
MYFLFVHRPYVLSLSLYPPIYILYILSSLINILCKFLHVYVTSIL